MVNKPYLKSVFAVYWANFKSAFCPTNVRTDLVVSQSKSEITEQGTCVDDNASSAGSPR